MGINAITKIGKKLFPEKDAVKNAPGTQKPTAFLANNIPVGSDYKAGYVDNSSVSCWNQISGYGTQT
ncbi:MAG: hypothetical protein LKG27_01225 [Clostridiaceae bacterium]|jgi:hypothetical protein|nr:hypothetical protein [Clostridiaceae bacterium]